VASRRPFNRSSQFNPWFTLQFTADLGALIYFGAVKKNGSEGAVKFYLTGAEESAFFYRQERGPAMGVNPNARLRILGENTSIITPFILNARSGFLCNPGAGLRSMFIVFLLCGQRCGPIVIPFDLKYITTSRV
jgi:hypothetical protein